jgi:hypothetical protein
MTEQMKTLIEDIKDQIRETTNNIKQVAECRKMLGACAVVSLSSLWLTFVSGRSARLLALF